MIVGWIIATALAVAVWFWIFYDISWISCYYKADGTVGKRRVCKGEAAWTASWITLASIVFGGLVYLAVGL